MLWKTLALGVRSSKIRKRYGGISKGKQVMLHDKETSQYFGYILGVGRKE
jgi:hypothetical protein